MKFGFTLAAACLIAAPALAEPPKPAVVVQTKPTSRMLAEFREMIRQVAGPVEAERLVKQFDAGLKESLGEQGFEGIDANRPIGAYAVLGDVPKDASLVIAVPVTGEKEFVAFLERLKFKIEPVQERKGVYGLQGPVEGILPKTHVQFPFEGWAYVGINFADPINARDLIPTAELFDNADPSLVTVKLYPGRAPEKLVKTLLADLDVGAAGIKQFLGGGAPRHIGNLVSAFFDEGPKLVRRYTGTGLNEATEVTLRFGWDPATGDTNTEISVIPKAGSSLAKTIATRPSGSNRFANLVPMDAVGGVVFQPPIFSPETRTLLEAAFEAGKQELKQSDMPEALHPVLDEVVKGLTRSMKAGELDGAIALVPAGDGKFTLVGGVSVNDTMEIEKELRKVGKFAALMKLFEFDAAKLGEVSIHKVPFHRGIPEAEGGKVTRLFGKDAPGYVAFAKDAVFMSYGPDALARIKAATAAKPGPAPALAMTANMKHVHALFGVAFDENVAGLFAKHVGSDDKTVNLSRITVEGGEKLSVRFSLNLRYIPKVFLLAVPVERNVNPPLP